MATFQVTGIEQVSANLAHIASRFTSAAAAALNEIAEATMTDAKERTPVDTGRLRASGKVEHAKPLALVGNIQATLTFGTEYAVYVHERTQLRHAVGEAKFLERAVAKTAVTFAADIAAGIKSRL